MADDVPRIDEGNRNWQVVQAWARGRIAELRDQREQTDMDLRKLDIALGGIQQLKQLLELPAALRRERERDPIAGDDFTIPPPKGY